MAAHRTGLLLLTSVPQVKQRLENILRATTNYVEKTLYVHFDLDYSQNSFRHKNTNPFTKNNKHLKETIAFLYGHAFQNHEMLDVRILLSDIKRYQSVWILQYPCDILLTDYPGYADAKFVDYVNKKFKNEGNMHIQPLGNSIGQSDEQTVMEYKVNDSNMSLEDEVYDHTVMGGTFDRLHAGHKILLAEACLRTRKRLTIGVTDKQMILNKDLCELIEPIDIRMKKLLDFLRDTDPTLEYNLQAITDPFGPSTVLPELQCIVTSEETRRGGEKVNEVRESKNLSLLALHTVSILDDACRNKSEEGKISSSNSRKRLLGKLLKAPMEKPFLSNPPYLIGLTGGIASGKSKICEELNKFGAAIINCDKLGHEIYAKGRTAYTKIIDTFGKEILDEDGTVNRRVLAAKVFANKAELSKLDSIAWPAIAELAKTRAAEFGKQGYRVVVLDAAVLLEAGWNAFVHEVWVSMVPKEEAVRRVMKRDNLDEAAAKQRVESQISNHERIDQANVVFCTFWAHEITTDQVTRAWKNLELRLSGSKV